MTSGDIRLMPDENRELLTAELSLEGGWLFVLTGAGFEIYLQPRVVQIRLG